MLLRGGVDGKMQLVAFEEVIQPSLGNSRLDPGPFFSGVLFDHVVHVAGKIQDDALAQFVAHAARASSPGDKGNFVLVGILYDLDHIILVLGQDDSQGLHLKKAGRAAVNRPAEVIAEHIPLDHFLYLTEDLFRI